MTEVTPEKIAIHSSRELTKYIDDHAGEGFSNEYLNRVSIELENFEFDPAVQAKLPGGYAEIYQAIPLAIHKQSFIIALADTPNRYDAIKNIEFITGRHVEALLFSSKEVDICVDRLYTTEDIIGLTEKLQLDNVPPPEKLEELKRQIEEKPLVALVRRIIHEAIRKEASDIHIRPMEDHIDYLLRIDGNMVHCSELDKRYLHALISRFKILGGMNIAEHRVPQDGSAKLSISGRVVEMRMSVMPTINGESLVVRLLNTDASLFHMDDLGFTQRDYNIILKSSHLSNGLVLVTGPTGSGKSTTLYAILQEIKKNTSINIITVEDPVEFHIDDIEQIQVNNKIDYTFAKALKNILRHDPDVIMIGEMRDEEAADIAIECALTGHLVLSTLHSVDCVSTVTRLLEMGVKPYLLKATLSAVVAQRLAKMNCKHCRVSDDSKIASHMRSDSAFDHIDWKKGEGCEECSYTGLKGRRGIYEVMLIDQHVNHVIREGVTEDIILDACKPQNMIHLAESATAMAEAGEISADEFIRLKVN